MAHKQSHNQYGFRLMSMFCCCQLNIHIFTFILHDTVGQVSRTNTVRFNNTDRGQTKLSTVRLWIKHRIHTCGTLRFGNAFTIVANKTLITDTSAWRIADHWTNLKPILCSYFSYPIAEITGRFASVSAHVKMFVSGAVLVVVII